MGQKFFIKVSQLNHKDIHKLSGLGSVMVGSDLLARLHLSQEALSHPTNPNTSCPHTHKFIHRWIGNSIVITQVSHTPWRRKQERDLRVPIWKNQSNLKTSRRLTFFVIWNLSRDNSLRVTPTRSRSLALLNPEISFRSCSYLPSLEKSTTFKVLDSSLKQDNNIHISGWGSLSTVPLGSS